MKNPRTIVLIGSLGTKKKHLNGESVKSNDIWKALRSQYVVKAFNLDKSKFFSTMGFFFFVIFHRQSEVMICKAPFGAKIIIKLLRFINFSPKRIITYIYGYGLHGYYEGRVLPSDISYSTNLIVESPALQKELEPVVSSKVSVFACLKPSYQIPIPPFEQKKILKLLFFSRIVEDKGVFEIAQAVIDANKDAVKFDLSFAGSVADKETIQRLSSLERKYPFIHILGESFTIHGRDSYLRFSEYDLHVFPSRFSHECAPGSIVDSFIAGVPTLSTRFHGYDFMLNPAFSYTYDRNDESQLKGALSSIYLNQEALYQKKSLCQAEATKYSYDSFLQLFSSMLS